MSNEKEVIYEPVRKKIENFLNETFKSKDGKSLDSAFSNILNDRDLNLFLMSNLPENEGILIGKTSYYSDTAVNLLYGLTVDFDEIPRRSKLFVLKEINYSGRKISCRNYSSFPDIYNKEYHFKGWLSKEDFVKEVNSALFSPKDYIINLK